MIEGNNYCEIDIQNKVKQVEIKIKETTSTLQGAAQPWKPMPYKAYKMHCLKYFTFRTIHLFKLFIFLLQSRL